jgi:group I intron endonuclease
MRGIYSITNSITGTVYYGQSKDIKRRLHDHRLYLNKNYHDNPKLQSAWNKYGESAFEFKHIELIEDITIDLTPIEARYYNSTDNKYNLQDPEKPTTFYGNKNRLNCKNSEEARKKQTEAQTGRKHPHTGFPNKHALGYRHTEEWKKKHSDIMNQYWTNRKAASKTL